MFFPASNCGTSANPNSLINSRIRVCEAAAHIPPTSTVRPAIVPDFTRPPTRFRASNTTTRFPAFASARAAINPENPAPTTTTSARPVSPLCAKPSDATPPATPLDHASALFPPSSLGSTTRGNAAAAAPVPKMRNNSRRPNPLLPLPPLSPISPSINPQLHATYVACSRLSTKSASTPTAKELSSWGTEGAEGSQLNPAPAPPNPSGALTPYARTSFNVAPPPCSRDRFSDRGV